MGITAADSALRRGLGAIKVIGSYYSVYRLGGTSGVPNVAASLIDPLNLVATNFSARIVPGLAKPLIEIEPVYKLIYNIICDARTLRIGDCLVEVGPQLMDAPDGRMFILADVQPLLPAQGPRTEILGTLSRPSSDGGNDPIQGRGSYQGMTKFTEKIAVLSYGLYDMALVGTASAIPMGIQPYTRIGGLQEFKFPSGTHRATHFIYIPPLPGLLIQPGDVVSDQNGNRFFLQNVSTFSTGLKGTVCIADSNFT